MFPGLQKGEEEAGGGRRPSSYQGGAKRRNGVGVVCVRVYVTVCACMQACACPCCGVVIKMPSFITGIRHFSHSHLRGRWNFSPCSSDCSRCKENTGRRKLAWLNHWPRILRSCWAGLKEKNKGKCLPHVCTCLKAW